MSYQMQWTELILDRLRYSVQQRVTRQMLQSACIETYMDHMLDQMVVQLEAEVLGRKVAGEHYEFTEEPAYPSWREQLVDSLALDSFRRRFLAYFWGFDPNAVPAKRVTHTVDVKLYDAYPESTVALPPEYGQPHRVAIASVE